MVGGAAQVSMVLLVLAVGLLTLLDRHSSTPQGEAEQGQRQQQQNGQR